MNKQKRSLGYKRTELVYLANNTLQSIFLQF